VTQLGIWLLLNSVFFLAVSRFLKSWIDSEDQSYLLKKHHGVDDYWDGEELDYDIGEVGANTGATVRHPKNRDRAYSGSAERFDDGGR
jgi:hypothetical protein